MFKHLLCNKVNIQKISKFDSYNNPIIDETITVNGKLEYNIKKVTDKNGDLVVSTGELRLLEKLTEFDRIDVEGTWKEIISIYPQDDFNGKVQYYVVYF